MKILKLFLFSTVMLGMNTSCTQFKKLTRQEKGAVIGVAGGGALGGLIGAKSKNPAVYAIVGSAIGGVAGAVIGKYMDKQAADIEKELGEVAEVERLEEGIKVTMGSGILFAFDSDDLSGEATANLQKLAGVLNDYKDTEILVAGHTDNVGSDSYNQKLSNRRAESVAQVLTNNGVARKRLIIMGFGEDSPAFDNDTPAGQYKNRRVELAIVADQNLKESAKKEAGVQSALK